jgi:hypothetical protein
VGPGVGLGMEGPRVLSQLAENYNEYSTPSLASYLYAGSDPGARWAKHFLFGTTKYGNCRGISGEQCWNRQILVISLCCEFFAGCDLVTGAAPNSWPSSIATAMPSPPSPIASNSFRQTAGPLLGEAFEAAHPMQLLDEPAASLRRGVRGCPSDAGA